MNIFAYTAPGPDFPEYVSVNDKGGQCEITVRSPARMNGGYVMGEGALAEMVLPREEIGQLINGLRAHLDAAKPSPCAPALEGFPRRNRIDLMSPAELAIRDAMLAVEAAGASPALTEAINLLSAAQDKVADHIEGAA